MTPLRIFIGWEPREADAFHVLAHSILTRASRPVTITPLVQSQLRAAGLYTRPPDPGASTEFSLTRFLVPHLAGYAGTAVFMDCDMLCQTDIAPLFQQEPGHAVWVCQHDYIPTTTVKMDGRPQVPYPRKNWSSLMVFDLQHMGVRALTPDYVNRATPADLHRFAWLREGELGALPLDWNWLVDEYAPNPAAKILHYTLGIPRLRPSTSHATAWFEEAARVR